MQSMRIAALRRFAVAISVLNVVGHTLLGFEQSWAQLLVAVATAYATELGLEAIGAWSSRSRPAFAGSVTHVVDFLLPAHITGLAVSMLLYANDRLAPFAFAAAVGIASKSILRVAVGKGTRHVLNPSNTGITATLLVFTWIGISPPYAFTERVAGAWDVIIPAIIVCSGTFVNARFTGRLPLIGAWVLGFAAQALVRTTLLGTPLVPALLPMSGMAFLLFSFYMISDPGTTPERPSRQIAFGVAAASAYGVLQVTHVVFGLFFALFIVCCGRGAILFARAWLAQEVEVDVSRPAAAAAVAKLDEVA